MLASLSCSLMGLAVELIQRLYQAQDPKAIAKKEVQKQSESVIFLNKLANLLSMELFKL